MYFSIIEIFTDINVDKKSIAIRNLMYANEISINAISHNEYNCGVLQQEAGKILLMKGFQRNVL